MNATPMPPMRSSRVWRSSGGLFSFDVWGHRGRPVLLLPAVLFDRVMWWPAGADLRPYATVIAVDLPGHGGSTRRARYDPYAMVDDLASLLHGLGFNRAPVVVGHASAAGLAERFAACYATHALVTVDAFGSSGCPPLQVDRYLAEMGLLTLPDGYRDLVQPINDARLLAAYAECMHTGRQPAKTPAVPACTKLALHSSGSAPVPDRHHAASGWRRETYQVPGRFPHLADVDRFVRDIRTVL